MILASQINSFSVPASIWERGSSLVPHLPALRLPAADAWAIERRSLKGFNLRNEHRRYTLCCERIQSIVEELALAPEVLEPPFIWGDHDDDKQPSAIAYLAVVEFFRGWLGGALKRAEKLGLPNPRIYPRIPALYFPPEHGEVHMQGLNVIMKDLDIETLYEGASKSTHLIGEFPGVSIQACRNAFELRYALVKSVAERKNGLVDVISIQHK